MTARRLAEWIEREGLVPRIDRVDLFRAEPPRRPRNPCACSVCGSARVEPPVSVCDRCGAERVAREARGAVERVVRQFPPLYRWADFSRPGFVPPGERAPAASARAVDAVRAWSGTLLVLRGPSGTGKTSLACAWLRREAEAAIRAKRRADDLFFIPCDDVAPDGNEHARAVRLLACGMSGREVVVDDLGADLSCAPGGGGLAAYRGAPVRRVIRRRHVTALPGEGRRTIVTTGLSNQQIGEAYGDDVLRRLTEDRAQTTILYLES